MPFHIRNHHHVLLALCAAALAVLCILSVSEPIRFQKKQKYREKIVRQRLQYILNAEERYRQRHGTYTGELKVLVGEGYLADSLQYIPFSDSKCFELDATTQLSRSGRQIPLMECKASYTDYLRGLNEHYIATLIEKANTAGRWPGLKIGDIEKPNHHAGNWE